MLALTDANMTAACSQTSSRRGTFQRSGGNVAKQALLKSQLEKATEQEC